MSKKHNNPPSQPMSPSTGNKQNVAVQASFSGPLPPPQILSDYDKIHPGLAERIIQMAENEASHRHKMEEKAIEAEVEDRSKSFKERRIGQILAFIIAVTAIIAGTYAATNGGQVAGTIIGGTGVVGLVSAFLYRRKTE